MSTLIEQAQELIDMHRDSEEKALESMAIKKELKAKKEAMALRLAEEGLQNVRCASGEMVSVKRQFFFSKTSDASQDQICAALRKCGLPEFIKTSYVAASLKSYAKELEEASPDPVDNLVDLLPEDLRPLFKTYEEMTVTILGMKKK